MLVRSHNLGDTLKSLALQSADCPVSDFLVRFYKNNETCSWEEVLRELKARFGDIIDCQHGLQVLRNTRQSKARQFKSTQRDCWV